MGLAFGIRLCLQKKETFLKDQISFCDSNRAINTLFSAITDEHGIWAFSDEFRWDKASRHIHNTAAINLTWNSKHRWYWFDYTFFSWKYRNTKIMKEKREERQQAAEWEREQSSEKIKAKWETRKTNKNAAAAAASFLSSIDKAFNWDLENNDHDDENGEEKKWEVKHEKVKWGQRIHILGGRLMNVAQARNFAALPSTLIEIAKVSWKYLKEDSKNGCWFCSWLIFRINWSLKWLRKAGQQVSRWRHIHASGWDREETVAEF